MELDANCSAKWQKQINGTIHVGDQGDVQKLYDIIDQTGLFDIVIDDGSHYPLHQIIR